MSLLAELKRRNVIRMACLYLVGAWLLVQVTGTVLPWFGVPESLLRGLVVVLAIGLLPALAFAWIYEITPEGLPKRAIASPSFIFVGFNNETASTTPLECHKITLSKSLF